MTDEEDPQDLDDFIFATLLVDDRTDGGRGCGGCLATTLGFVVALALVGLAVTWLAALLGAR